MPRTLLIDGDIFAYQIASSAETPIDWGDDLWTLHSDLGPARVKVEERFEIIKDRLQADDFIVALSDSDNFRKDGMYVMGEEKVKTGATSPSEPEKTGGTRRLTSQPCFAGGPWRRPVDQPVGKAGLVS